MYISLEKDKKSDDTLSTISTVLRGKPYERNEEMKIIQWIIANQRYSEVKGIAMWKRLQNSNNVPGRTYLSLKERFLKQIAPNIQHYNLKEDAVEKFRLYLPLKNNKNHKNDIELDNLILLSSLKKLGR